MKRNQLQQPMAPLNIREKKNANGIRVAKCIQHYVINEIPETRWIDEIN